MLIDQSKWLWLDLEMTGLDPTKDKILEVATIITDTNLVELDGWTAVVKQPDEVLDTMKDAPWYEYNPQTGERNQVGSVYDMHTQNGLIERVQTQGLAEDEVQKQIVELIEKQFSGQATLAGNSIHQDRRFIRQWWPLVEAKLHYQMLDVTSFKLLLRAQDSVEFEKTETHNALDDIRASIEELKFFLNHFKTRE